MKFNEDIKLLIISFCLKTYGSWKHIMDFDDYLQDCYLEVLERLKYYDSSKSHIGNYIYMVLFQKWWRFRRSETYKQMLFEKEMYTRKIEAESIASDGFKLEDFIEDDDISVKDCINVMEKLDQFEKIIPMLKKLTIQHYIKGIPQTELAKINNTTKQSINAKIQRNINNIKKYIDRHT
jgi:RNA polymerase sigma factor (sigma-70 family)